MTRLGSSYNSNKAEPEEHSRKCPAYNCPMLKSVLVEGDETCRYHAAKPRTIWPKISELLNNNLRLLDLIYYANRLAGHEFEQLKANNEFELEQSLKPKNGENHIKWAERVEDSIYRELKRKIISMERELESARGQRKAGVSAALQALSNGTLRKTQRAKSFESMQDKRGET